MKKKYLFISLFLLLSVIFVSIFFVEIPSPSKMISEKYKLEN